MTGLASSILTDKNKYRTYDFESRPPQRAFARAFPPVEPYHYQLRFAPVFKAKLADMGERFGIEVAQNQPSLYFGNAAAAVLWIAATANLKPNSVVVPVLQTFGACRC
jgi:hypothetical protein